MVHGSVMVFGPFNTSKHQGARSVSLPESSTPSALGEASKLDAFRRGRRADLTDRLDWEEDW